MGNVYKWMGISQLDTVWVSEFLFLLLPAVIFILINGFNFKETFSLNKISFWNLFSVFLLAIFSQPVMGFIANVTAVFFKGLGSNASSGMESRSCLYLIMVIAVTPAICEEAVMRGVIFSGYKKESTVIAVLMNGLYFGLLHMNPIQFFYAFFAGVLFAYILKITGSIFATSLFHFLHNGISVIFYKGLSKYYARNIPINDTQLSGALYKALGLFIQFLLAALCVFIIILILKQLKQYNKQDKVMLHNKQVIKAPCQDVFLKFGVKEITDEVQEAEYKTFDFYTIASIVLYFGYLIFYCVITKTTIFKLPFY